MSELLVVESTAPQDFDFNDNLYRFLNDLGFEPGVISHEEAARNTARILDAGRIIMAGVPYAYAEDKAKEIQPELSEWIHKVKVPLLGICLGHQALALAFGATMLPNGEREVGFTTANIIQRHKNDPIFDNLDRSFTIEALHWASVSIRDTNRINRLANSKPHPGVSETGCLNQILRIKGTQFYGTQFHPENTEDGKLLLKNFLVMPTRAYRPKQ